MAMPLLLTRNSRMVFSCVPNRFLMIEIARLHLAERLEVAQQDHGVGEVGDVDGGLHVADEPVLGDGQEGRGALPVQVLQQLVDVQDEELLLRHGGLVAVEAVDHDRLDLMPIDAGPHPVGELARRELRGVDLLDEQVAGGAQGLQVDAHQPGPVDQQAELLVEDEQRRLLAAFDGRDGELQREKGLAGPGRSHQQGARALLDAAAEQGVEFADAAREDVAREAGLVLAGDEARKHLDAAGRDDEVMEPAPEALAAVLDHAQAAALGAVVRAPAPRGGSRRGRGCEPSCRWCPW